VFSIEQIFSGTFVVSVVILCMLLGIIIASYAVTAGMNLIGFKLGTTTRKTVVVIAAVLAGYLGLVWALAI